MTASNSTIKRLEEELKAAQSCLKAATSSLAPKHQGGEMERYHEAYDRLLRCERELTSARGEEFAEPLDFPAQWDVGAPAPHLLVDDYRAFLIFRLSVPDPTWDGKSVKVVSPDDVEPWGLVEFDHCLSAKLGSPNDEVFNGHPLYGRGLRIYAAQVVRNSRWISEIEKINSVHHRYDPAFWRDLIHYVFLFHDTSFECIARSYTFEAQTGTAEGLLREVCQRLVRA